MNFLDLARIKTDEAETWHTLRLLVYLSVRQVSASYLSISSLKFRMNLAAECTAAHRPSLSTLTPKVSVQSERSEDWQRIFSTFPPNIHE